MSIEHIHLINFRNYPGLQMDFHPKTNVIVGKNAVGKTNLCEAIYICHQGKSFRGGRDRDLIQFHKDSAYIGARMSLGPESRFVEVKYHQLEKKSIRINESLVPNLRELRRNSPIVLFTPNHLELIKGSPGRRREFMDHVISQIQPMYEGVLQRYNRVMNQRNQLLRQYPKDQEFQHLLQVYDDQLMKYGLFIIRERLRLVKSLGPIASEKHMRMTKGKEELEVQYASFFAWDQEEQKNWPKIYENLLKGNRKRDLHYKSTSVGPHRDDLIFYINQMDGKIFGSQGQQRSTVLSLKMAELDLIEQELNIRPVLILDDVFSELDRERKAQLMAILKRSQSFITMTDAMALDELRSLDKKIYTIEDKKIKTIL